MDQQKIFIVDDEEGVANMCADYLKPAYKVQVFHSAKDAIAAFEKDEPDAVITDIKMPGMDGMQLTEDLRQKKHFNKPIIMMSGFADKKHALKALDQKVTGMIEKPFEPSALKSMLDKAVSTPNDDKINEQLLTCYGRLTQAALALVGKYRDRYTAAENTLYEAKVDPHKNPQAVSEFMNNIRIETKLEDTVEALTTDITNLLLKKKAGSSH